MQPLKGACIIGQSGGPTAVINASALGAIQTALTDENITRVLAAEYGILGILNDRLFDCAKEDPAELELLRNTPASALGSCRYKLKDFKENDTDYKRVLEVFKKYDVRYFFYNGGNDSMDTCNKISKYMQQVGYDCRIIGIPKTVDNDLFATDHCPGYASAAKYIATSTAEISRDNAVYGKKSVVILEIMGRHAGWLTAASALAREIGDGPDLVYLPEVAFHLGEFVEDVKAIAEAKPSGSVIVALSEGVGDGNGKLLLETIQEGGGSKDAFGHTQLGGVGLYLADYLKEQTGYKTRAIEYSLLQRCSAHCASKTDVDEAYLAGAEAVKQAVLGATDAMIGFRRQDGERYVCETVLVPLGDVANKEQKIPREWINARGNDIGEQFTRYALPLIAGEAAPPSINGLPRYANLKKVFVTE